MNEIKKLLLNQGKSEVVEGVPPLVFEQSKGSNLKDYKIYGNSKKSNNLLDVNKYVMHGEGLVEIDGDDVRIEFTSDDGAYCTYMFEHLEPGATYIFSFYSYNNVEYWVTDAYNSADTIFPSVNSAHIKKLVADDDGMIVVDFVSKFEPTAYNLKNMKLEKSDVATAYLPRGITSLGDKTKNLWTHGDLDCQADKDATFYYNLKGTYTISFGLEFESYTSSNAGFFGIMVDGVEQYMLPYYIVENGAETVSRTFTGHITQIKLYNWNNIVGKVVRMQIDLGDEKLDYEPGGYKIPVMTRGKNHIPFPYHYGTITRNGITFTNNGDRSVTANGTATANADYEFIWDCDIKKGMYIISGTEDDSQITHEVFVNGYDGTVMHSYQYIPADHDFTANRIFIRIRPNKTVNNLTFYPRLEYGVPIQSNIYLKEPLRKIGNYSDYIDFANKKVVRNIKEIILDGSDDENWTLQSINSYGIANFLNQKMGQFKDTSSYVSDRFERQTTGISETQTEGIMYANGYAFYLRIKAEKASTVSELREWLKQNNTSVVFATVEPTEEKIELPTIPTLQGDGEIELDTRLNASNMMVKYKKG